MDERSLGCGVGVGLGWMGCGGWDEEERNEIRDGFYSSTRRGRKIRKEGLSSGEGLSEIGTLPLMTRLSEDDGKSMRQKYDLQAIV